MAHDLEPVWTQTSQRLAPALAGHRDALAACFAKFPTPLYRQWALDVGAEILRTPEAPEAAATAVIRLVPWLARHGKVRTLTEGCFFMIPSPGGTVRSLSKKRPLRTSSRTSELNGNALSRSTVNSSRT